jgi:hypothetical protein
MNTSATFVLVHGKQKGDSVDFAKTFAAPPAHGDTTMSLSAHESTAPGTG